MINDIEAQNMKDDELEGKRLDIEDPSGGTKPVRSKGKAVKDAR